MGFGIFSQVASDGLSPWWVYLFSGMGWTLLVAGASALIALCAGSLVGIARTLDSGAVRGAAMVYVEVFRSIPLVVQFFVWYFLLPEVVPPLKQLVQTADPVHLQLATAVVCLGLFTSARVAEQVRAAVMALPRGQRNAAYALGLTQWQAYRHVLMPVAYRMIVPPLTSEAMSLVKNTSVAYSIGLAELFFRAMNMGETTFRYFEAFAASALGYVSIALSIALLMGHLDRRVALVGSIARKAA